MFAGLFSFLAGSAFRLIFGGVMEWLGKKQDHQHEMELQRLQADLEAGRHERDMARISLQAQLQVQQITVVADAAERKAEADAFIEAVKATATKTGIAWVDAWNQSIRPAGATISLLIWVGVMVSASLILSDFDRELIGAFLGVFVGERIHARLR